MTPDGQSGPGQGPPERGPMPPSSAPCRTPSWDQGEVLTQPGTSLRRKWALLGLHCPRRRRNGPVSLRSRTPESPWCPDRGHAPCPHSPGRRAPHLCLRPRVESLALTRAHAACTSGNHKGAGATNRTCDLSGSLSPAANQRAGLISQFPKVFSHRDFMFSSEILPWNPTCETHE